MVDAYKPVDKVVLMRDLQKEIVLGNGSTVMVGDVEVTGLRRIGGSYWFETDERDLADLDVWRRSRAECQVLSLAGNPASLVRPTYPGRENAGGLLYYKVMFPDQVEKVVAEDQLRASPEEFVAKGGAKEYFGKSTGFMDTAGVEIRVGDILRLPVTVNADVHGSWADFVLDMAGIVPVLKYVQSEAGRVLPPGYLTRLFSDLYDQEMLMGTYDTVSLSPVDTDVRVQLSGSCLS